VDSVQSAYELWKIDSSWNNRCASLSMAVADWTDEGARQWSSCEVVGRYDLKLWITHSPEALTYFLVEIQDEQPALECREEGTPDVERSEQRGWAPG